MCVCCSSINYEAPTKVDEGTLLCYRKVYYTILDFQSAQNDGPSTHSFGIRLIIWCTFWSRILYYTILCTLLYSTLCYTALSHTMLYYTMSYHTLLYSTLPYYTMRYQEQARELLSRMDDDELQAQAPSARLLCRLACCLLVVYTYIHRCLDK